MSFTMRFRFSETGKAMLNASSVGRQRFIAGPNPANQRVTRNTIGTKACSFYMTDNSFALIIHSRRRRSIQRSSPPCH